MSKKAFLICPVRGVDPEASRHIVEQLEADGWAVYWPTRDTDQDDGVGYRICKDNLAAIRASDHVFIVWDGKSQGTLFDAGMAFALGKPITCVSLPELTPYKSFQNMFTKWEKNK